jgi:hypothetical protein
MLSVKLSGNNLDGFKKDRNFPQARRQAGSDKQHRDSVPKKRTKA